MQVQNNRWCWPAVVVMLVWTLAPATALPAPATPDSAAQRKTETPAEKIRRALDQVTDLEIDNQSFQLAVAQLREQTKVNFVLDRQSVASVGVDIDNMPVSVKLQKVKLRSGLRTFLGQHNLSFAIVGDAVLITTEEMAIYRQLKQRVSLELSQVQFGAALKQLARETATNLLMDSRVLKESQASVTLQLDDVPLETAVRLMAEMAGLKPVRVGNVLLVTSKANAADMRNDPDLVAPPQPGNPGGDIMMGPGGRFVMPAVGPAPPAPMTAPPGSDKPADPPPPGGGEAKPPASGGKPEPPTEKPPMKGEKE